MKKVFSYFIAAALILSIASPAFASSTKCSHRTASSSNDLFRNTNPPAKSSAQMKVKTKTKSVRGTR